MGFVCRDEPEKVLSFKAKKKVTFDPNVKIYEYVSCNEVSDFYLENEGSGKKGEEKNKAKSSNSKSFLAQIHLLLFTVTAHERAVLGPICPYTSTLDRFCICFGPHYEKDMFWVSLCYINKPIHNINLLKKKKKTICFWALFYVMKTLQK
jgi:hypothetical protein